MMVKNQKKYGRLLCLVLTIVLVLSLVPTAVLAAGGANQPVDTQIIIKPKNVSGEFMPHAEVIYSPTELEYEGSGRLNDGDVFADVVYSGERRYAGETETAIVSYKIMRGDVDVTELYTNITKKTGKIEVSAFGMPAPYYEMLVEVGKSIPIYKFHQIGEIWDWDPPTFTGVGEYDATSGYTAPQTVGRAELVFTSPAEDRNSDGINDMSPCINEVAIIVYKPITVGEGGDYATIQAAVNAANNGDVIKLLGDNKEFNQTVTVATGQNIAIDLNGNKIIVDDDRVVLVNNGTLTLMNNSDHVLSMVSNVENNGPLTIIDAEVDTLTNNNLLIIEGGEINKLINNAETVNHGGDIGKLENSGSVFIGNGLLVEYESKNDSAKLEAEGGFYVFDVSDYVREDAVVTRLSYAYRREISGIIIRPSCDEYAVNASTAEHSHSLHHFSNVAAEDIISASFVIVKANADTELEIENFRDELLIDNNTNVDIILNGHLVAAGTKGARICDLPIVYPSGEFAINVVNGTARIGGDERYHAIEGEIVQLNSSGAPDGQEFDKWVIDGVDTNGLDLTKGTLTFSMPAQDVSATAIYKMLNASSGGTNQGQGGNVGMNDNGSVTDKGSNSDTNAAATSPKTGDTSSLLLWLVMLAIGAFATASVVVYKKRVK